MYIRSSYNVFFYALDLCLCSASFVAIKFEANGNHYTCNSLQRVIISRAGINVRKCIYPRI